MEFVDWVLEVSEIATGCFVFGFFGAFGIISAFCLGLKLYENKEEYGHGVIGH